jgi:ferric-dicitrate binding protein FerR (iron transport regulator)
MELMQMIQSSDNDAELKGLIETSWMAREGDQKLSVESTERILSEILSTQADNLSITETITEKRFVPHFYFKIAAAFALLLLTASILFLFVLPDSDAVELVDKKQITPEEEHQYIKLPDGSVVLLNAGSYLDYPTSFENYPTREVTLLGEAYFDIKHDPTKEFIVYTGKLKTTVLGTAFNIKAYAGDSSITVTVTRGKVKVSDDKQVFGIITPDQELTFDKGHDRVKQRTVESKESIAWTERDIFFDDTTLGEAMDRLESKFDVDIDFEDTYSKNCRFTATFVGGEDLEQILKVICEFNGTDFNESGNKHFVITGKGCL